MPNILDGFVEMSFENGKDITSQQINAEYEKGNHFLYIYLTDDNFTSNIYLPNSNTLDPIKGSIIKIVNESLHLSTVYFFVETIINDLTIFPGQECTALGHPDLGWSVI